MNVKKIHTGPPSQPSLLIIGKPVSLLPAALRSLAAKGARLAVFADRAVARSVGAPLVRSLKRAGYAAELIAIRPGERSKSLVEAGRLCRVLAKKGYDRNSWVIAAGGGVVGDLAGFVAATYLRGVPLIQIPTTLLAQVDAAIGGKTAVDIPEGKNLVGSFYQPRWVWIDPKTLRSLPLEQWRNGLGEVIKYGAIRDARLFETLEAKMDELVRGYSPAWDSIIARCASIKAEVVRRDPLETNGVRALLNFGHSVGHAIEGATGYRAYHHGEAISIGMAVAAKISQQLGLLKAGERLRLETLLMRAGLPLRPRERITRGALAQYLSRDKKARSGRVRFVLLKKLGQAVSGQSVGMDVLGEALSATGL